VDTTFERSLRLDAPAVERVNVPGLARGEFLRCGLIGAIFLLPSFVALLTAHSEGSNAVV
jgi:hypothetical protein